MYTNQIYVYQSMCAKKILDFFLDSFLGKKRSHFSFKMKKKKERKFSLKSVDYFSNRIKIGIKIDFRKEKFSFRYIFGNFIRSLT